MALSWNEIKDRALKFTKEWEGESRERAEKDTFWNDFFDVFGISRRRLATFEEPVKTLKNTTGFIDLFWKGTLLVEHKSKGKDLDAAFAQASDYFHGIKEHELPKYVLVSDFDRFRLYDLDENTHHEFELKEFHKNIKLFGFIAGYQKKSFKDEDPVNIQAAELMGKLHDLLEESGYEGHVLEVFLVRLLFALFADDTGIFEKDTFKEFIEVRTNIDGSDLGAWLAQFFQVLNTPADKRLKNLDEHLSIFPYVNGKLFEEPLPIAAFNSRMREILLECGSLDWGKISPAIFGSMFQSVMNPEERRNLGAHYTSEKNILKLIKPLFLDELWAEFNKIKNAPKLNKSELLRFHEKLGNLKFLDPACGCGNFLIITYRELRLLEIEVIKLILAKIQKIDLNNIAGYAQLNVGHFTKIDVDQFYGIEYDEFPAKIAEVAMWLMDHQLNQRISEAFGTNYARLPLKKSAKIVNGNALRIDWEEVVPKAELSYILGNPPFVGYSLQSKEQKEDMKVVFADVSGAGVLDYVAAWYKKASEYINLSNISVAFVSTNSISQGEQVGILWSYLLMTHNIQIVFAHRSFQWNNEARGKAGVYVVIVGFNNYGKTRKYIYDYETPQSEPQEIRAKNINPYLVDADDVFILKRNKPISKVPEMVKGSQPTDGGNLLLNEDEKRILVDIEPMAKKYIKRFISAREYLNNKGRWCLWLVNASPSDLKQMPNVRVRIQNVREMRLASKKAATRKWADFPSLFTENRQPTGDYILVPRHSSENRRYIPFGFFTANEIVADSCSAIPNATLFHFGILTSLMHMAWVKYVCGRLESRYRYSNSLVYNNFPFPNDPSEKNKKLVEVKAQTVLDARAEFPDSSLADLYDPLTMPPKLVKAHQALDKAVDLCYRPQPFPNETARIEFLFELYNEYTMPLLRNG